MADPLSVAGSVVGVISLGITVTKSLVDFYTTARDQKSNVAYTAGKLNRLLDILQVLRGQLTDHKFRADKEDLLEDIKRSVYACEEHIHELQTENDKFKDHSTARRLAYPFRQSTLQKLEEDIDEAVSHLSLALQLLQQKDISNVRDDVDDAKSLLGLVRADQISSSIRNWLGAPDASVEYNKACKKRHPHTGLWLVKGPPFHSWLETPNSFLWLNGFAGCGKSVLCSTAIQYAFRHRRSSPRVGTAFFFFTFDDQSKQDASAMLRALVLQLSSQLRDNHNLLSRLHDSYRNTTPPDHALADCLHQLIRMFDHVYLLLDALDESPRDKHREGVLQALVDLRAWSEPGLHLLVTSRNETDIRDVLRTELGASWDEIIPMKSESVDRDIAAFTSQHLRDNRRLQKWKDYHDRIEATFAERAKGVFRWVECQFKALEQCPQSKHLLGQLLDSLPQSLDQTYERMLLNIAPTCVQYSQRMLVLLCCAKRPLTVPELIDGIAVELGDRPKFNPSRRLETVDAIHEVCPGFIEVDEPTPGETATVRIAHFSVQEYLESERILGRKAAIFSVRKRQAHTDIACVCLTYLLEPMLLTAMDPDKEYPLSFYAAKTWHEHLCDGDESAHSIQRQTLRLFQNAAKFKNWVKIWNADGYSNGQKPAGKVPSPVYYASLLGLDLLLSKLFDENAESALCSGLGPAKVLHSVNAQGGEYGNPLQAASARGHEAVVRLLLERGADANAKGGYYGSALQAASARDCRAIVRLLLEKNANVNAQGGEYGNALYAASARGHEAVVQLLLDRNANIDARGGEFGNALYAASAGGHEAVVQLLLERNANVNIQHRQYGNALYAASARGHEAVVRLLLERGADVNAQGGEYGTALYAASARGHEAIVKLLLEGNADVNVQGGFYGNALQAAAMLGHEKVARLLLERNTDAGVSGGSPLNNPRRTSREYALDSISGKGGSHQESRVAVTASAQVESHVRQLQPYGVNETPDEARNSSRGRARKKGGRGTGAVGLGNLGNSGYINSALQCIRSVEELTKYFLTGEYAEDINKQNPLGFGGKMAAAYGHLLKGIYSTSNDSILPSGFRSIVGSCLPIFASRGQQDAQEFLGFLLDALQEDLNRVTKRPYIEAPESTDEMVHDEVALAEMADKVWDIAAKRTESAVSDLFTGLYKTTLSCTFCPKIGIYFDHFSCLTLPFPIGKPWAKSVKFYPLNDCPVEIEVEIPQQSTVDVFMRFISDRTGVPLERLIGAEEFKCKFFKIYDDITNISEDILGNDIPAVHELETKPSNWPPKPISRAKRQQEVRFSLDPESSGSGEVPFDSTLYDHLAVSVFHRRDNKRSQTGSPDESNGIPPHFIVLNREETRSEDAIRRKILEKVATFTTWNGFHGGDWGIAGNIGAEITHALDADGMVDVSRNSAANSPPATIALENRPPNLLKVFNKRRPRWVNTSESLDPRLQNMFDLGYFSDTRPFHREMSTGWDMIKDDKVFPRLSSDRIPDPISPMDQNSSGQSSRQNGNGSGNGSENNDILNNLNVVSQDQPANTMPNNGPGPLVRLGEGIVVDWTDSAWDLLFGLDSTDDPGRGAKTYINLPKLQDPDLEQKKTQRISRQATGISLDECLDEFERLSILSPQDTWYCPRCKEHRRACKKFDLWKTPDILVCHLKRFHSVGFRAENIGCQVNFPMEGLDLERRVLKKEDGKVEVYDLISVLERFGGTGGGHNTASAKNFIDGKWYHYDDSIVEVLENPNVVVRPAAYVLFYRRRSERPLGGPRFEGILRAYAQRDSDTERADDWADEQEVGG